MNGLRGLVIVLAAVGLLACSPESDSTALKSQDQVVENDVPGNPTCASLGLTELQHKVEPPQSGTWSIDPKNTITVVKKGLTFDWSATIGIDAVIVKGGPTARVYAYDPEEVEGFGLHAPVNPKNGQYYGLSHISFCYDYEVMVTKTAQTSFDREYEWAIDKEPVGPTSLTLAPGQPYVMSYTVTVKTTKVTDTNFEVTGTIEVYNPAPFPATVVDVTDTIDGTPADQVSCPVGFPHSLAPFATLTCSYSSVLPDGVNRVNEAEAITIGKVGPGSGTAAVDFSKATVNAVDDCVDVTDDKLPPPGSLGTVCAADQPAIFSYDLTISYTDCGPYRYKNTATFVTNTTGASGSDSVVVDVDVPCRVGCTLTPGYWKTHSIQGPAPYDETWAQLPLAEQTPFFLSGQTYHDVLWTAPKKGNAYYILAHAYIAAQLNDLNGAWFADADTAFGEATTLLQSHTPAQIEVMPKQDPVRAEMIALAQTLDDYNNGITGPGHCSE